MFEENDMHWHTKRASRYKQRVHDKNMKYDSMRLCAAAGCNLDVCFHQEPPGLQKWPRRTRVFLSWLKTDSPLTPMARSQQNHSYHSDVLDVRALFSSLNVRLLNHAYACHNAVSRLLLLFLFQFPSQPHGISGFEITSEFLSNQTILSLFKKEKHTTKKNQNQKKHIKYYRIIKHSIELYPKSAVSFFLSQLWT